MKKVGIITVYHLPNWGSALQAYALQKTIESLGYDCECINYLYPNPWHIKRGCWGWPKTTIIQRLKTFLRLMLGRSAPSLNTLINNFIKKEIKESRYYNTYEDIHQDPPKYDIYVSGSDQIWNWKTMFVDTTYMLDIAPNDKLKIAYSSSFSVNSIPNEYKPIYSKWLSRYQALSVREKNGVSIIEDLIRREAKVVLDPSLLLNYKQWGELAKKAQWKKKLPSRYILCYMLGYTYDPKPAMAALLRRLQVIYKCPVIMLGKRNDKFDGEIFQMPRNQGIGVYEFLWLIRHASVVVSSSFHGSAFAINMGVPLISLIERRDQPDDRITTLLKSVGLENNIVTTTTDFDKMYNDGQYDVKLIQYNLQLLRENSLTYLRKSLS